MPNLAHAYDVAGHYYTHVAILQEAYSSPPVDPYRFVESFCAELPDLAQELDAISQRKRVFWSLETGWITWRRCFTRACVHMLATEFYLHALTGKPTKDIRDAALAVIESLDKEIGHLQTLETDPRKAKPEPQHLVNLWCERGFAIHLLGDTYAHSKLRDRANLYYPGTGHFKDRHQPDLLLRRGEAHWKEWVKQLAQVLRSAPSGSKVARISGSTIEQISTPLWPKGDKRYDKHYGECLMQKQLAEHADAWNKWSPGLEDWSGSACGSEQYKWGKWKKFNSYLGPTSGLESCQDVINYGPHSNSASVTTLRDILNELSPTLPLPECSTVWENYLARAIKNFENAAKVTLENSQYLLDFDVDEDKLGYGSPR